MKWHEIPSVFRLFHYAAGGQLNTHAPTGAAVATGSRVRCPDGKLRAVARFYDGGQQCYAGAWSGSVRIAGRTVRGRIYVSPDYGAEIVALRLAPDRGIT